MTVVLVEPSTDSDGEWVALLTPSHLLNSAEPLVPM